MSQRPSYGRTVALAMVVCMLSTLCSSQDTTTAPSSASSTDTVSLVSTTAMATDTSTELLTSTPTTDTPVPSSTASDVPTSTTTTEVPTTTTTTAALTTTTTEVPTTTTTTAALTTTTTEVPTTTTTTAALTTTTTEVPTTTTTTAALTTTTTEVPTTTTTTAAPTTAVPTTTTTMTAAPPPNTATVFSVILNEGTTVDTFVSSVASKYNIEKSSVVVISSQSVFYDTVNGTITSGNAAVSRENLRVFLELSLILTNQVEFAVLNHPPVVQALLGLGTSWSSVNVLSFVGTSFAVVTTPTPSTTQTTTTPTPPFTSAPPTTTTAVPSGDSTMTDKEKALAIGIPVAVGGVVFIGCVCCLMKRCADRANAAAIMSKSVQQQEMNRVSGLRPDALQTARFGDPQFVATTSTMPATNAMQPSPWNQQAYYPQQQQQQQQPQSSSWQGGTSQPSGPPQQWPAPTAQQPNYRDQMQYSAGASPAQRTQALYPAQASSQVLPQLQQDRITTWQQSPLPPVGSSIQGQRLTQPQQQPAFQQYYDQSRYPPMEQQPPPQFSTAPQQPIPAVTQQQPQSQMFFQRYGGYR